MPPARATQQERPDDVLALEFIKHYVDETGYPPSLREIATACGWRSASSSNKLLQLLQARGMVRVTPGVPRGLQITEAGMAAITETV